MGAPIFPEIWVQGVPIFRGTHISVTPVHELFPVRVQYNFRNPAVG